VVVDGGGGCIPGATITVVAGETAGQTLTQVTPCNRWDGDGGFLVQGGLTAGVAMTLRAAAAGYGAKEVTVPASFGRAPTIIVLAREMGTLEIRAETVGAPVGFDTYRIEFGTPWDDVHEPVHVAANGSFSTRLATGAYVLHLTALAPNCGGAAGERLVDRPARVSADSVTVVTFRVVCAAA
jgi:hypothetical protein